MPAVSVPAEVTEQERATLHAGLGGLSFPVYIPTRGRPLTQRTVRYLLKMGVTPNLIVQEDEREAYAEANPACRVWVWPEIYLAEYERTPELDPHPTTGAAHNFAWDHSRAAGFSHHWILDDNLYGFWWRSAADGPQPKGTKGILPATVEQLAYHETLIRRFRNLAGLSLAQTNSFSSTPFMINTRLYCATLYRNDLDTWGLYWRRGLNDDTIFSIDVLKTGFWCTAESRVLMVDKTPTSRHKRLSGGMTEFYNAQGGFLKKAAEAVRVHPDCVKVVERYGRVHHQIDYSAFKQRLVKISDAPLPLPPSPSPPDDPAP